MKKSFCIKGIALVFTMAAQICLPSLLRAAHVLPNALPTIKTGFANANLLASVSTQPYPVKFVSYKEQNVGSAKAVKLTKTMLALAHWDIKNQTKKNPKKRIGLCAKYVRLGFEAIGVKFRGGSAENGLDQNLIEAGFKKINPSKDKLLPGDIALVGSPGDQNPHGHTTTLTLEGWLDGSIQEMGGRKHPNPYNSTRRIKFIDYYRHPALSNDSENKKESYKWQFASHDYLIKQSPSTIGAEYSYAPTVQGYVSYVSEKSHIYLLKQEEMNKFIASLAGKKLDFDYQWLANSVTMNGIPIKQASNISPLACGAGIAAALLPGAIKLIKTAQTRTPQEPTGSQPVLKTMSARTSTNTEGQYDTNTLRAQWNAARKAVLKRNAGLKKEKLDIKAHTTLKHSVIAMSKCLAPAMHEDAAEAFKAARYVYNKLDDRSLFAATDDIAKQKQDILAFMSANLDKIAAQDAALSVQAAKFIFQKAGKGILRETVRTHAAVMPLPSCRPA